MTSDSFSTHNLYDYRRVIQSIETSVGELSAYCSANAKHMPLAPMPENTMTLPSKGRMKRAESERLVVHREYHVGK